MQDQQLTHIQFDFKREIYLRFGSKRGYLTTASVKLGVNYMYLSHIIGGRHKPSKELLIKLKSIPVLPQEELNEIKSNVPELMSSFPQSLADQIEAIQKERGFKTFEETVIAVIKGGLHYYNTQVRANSPEIDPLN